MLPTDEAERRELLLEVDFYQLHDLLVDIHATTTSQEAANTSSSSPAGGIFQGSILLDASQQRQLADWCPPHIVSSSIEEAAAGQWALLYRASRDGPTAESFHRLCDDRGPTYVVIRSTTGHLFGGFAAAAWNSTRAGYQVDADAFLFTLANPHGLPATRYPVAVPSLATYCLPRCGPCFGLDVFVPAAFEHASIKFPSSYADSTGLSDRTFTGHPESWHLADLEVFGLSPSSSS